MFDCCHAGGIGLPKDSTTPTLKTGFSESYYDTLRQEQGRAILASSRSSKSSYVLPSSTNSLFTKHLLEGLQGGIFSNNGLIRTFDLFEYLQPKITAEEPRQHPIFKANLEENFPIALYLSGQKEAIPKVEKKFPLIADAKDQPGILPLLQETMVELSNHLQRQFLPATAYKNLEWSYSKTEISIGTQPSRLQIAIANHGESVWRTLS
ncbi:MAG: hypothetical protein MGG11_03925 [Trichodesmium sp. MAG_R03]|nr:hypothetical protein [Trichodesmium sp. MAG_R03]